jgi:ribosomal protein S12 methylthiotransferase accessory factor
MAATARSSSAQALAETFARAADYLAGPQAGARPEDDVAGLLQSLEYDAEPGTAELSANRTALLRAAAQFARVFQLSAPEAPGLVFFGGEVDPSAVAAEHEAAPLTGVGGMGLSMRAAFEACIGEGIEYLSQFEAGEESLVTCSGAEMRQAARGEGRQFLADLLQGTEGADGAKFDCLAATALLDDAKMLLPAEICLRRSPARARMKPPFLLSMGCAAGPSKADAVLHGLCELVERDAAGLWWRGGTRGRPLALDDPASAEGAVLLAKLRRSQAGRRTWLLDIATDLGIPAVAAISCRADGKGFAFGLGARPTVAGAVRGAIMELCQTELAQAVVAAKQHESGPDKLNARDRAHIVRATHIDADACALLHPQGMPVRREACASQDAVSQIGWLATRLAAGGIDTFAIDLTRPRYAVPVVRVVAPGLQIEPSQLQSVRLQRAIAATGGGGQHTGGVELF